MDVPGKVTIHQGRELEEQHIENVVDVIRATPGVDFTTSSGSGRSANISVRGLSSAALLGGMEQPTALYVDGVYIGKQTGFHWDLADVARVEILRGPQGTLYGKNALAGAIKVDTHEPTDSRTAELSTTFGNYDLRQVHTMANSPLLDETVQVRFNFDAIGRDGYVRNRFTATDIDTAKGWRASGKIRWVSPQNGKVVTAFDYTKERPVRTAAGPYESINDHVTAFTDNYEERRDVYGVSLNAEFETMSGAIKSISAMRGFEFAAAGSDFTTADYLRQGLDDDQQQVSQEVRLETETSSTRLVSGVFLYFDDHLVEAYQELRNLAGVFGKPFGHREGSSARTKSAHAAVFGNVAYDVTERVELAAGLRTIFERKWMDYSHAGVGSTAVLATQQSVQVAQNHFDVTPEFTARYSWSSFLQTYIRLARGVRSGGFNNVAVSGTDFWFEPETGVSYEVGLKSILLDNRLDFSLSGFWMDIENQQTQSLVGAFATRTTNAAKARTRGIDLAMAFRPTDRLELLGEASVVDAEFTDYPAYPIGTASNPGATTDVTGNRLPFHSPISLGASVRYKEYIMPETALILRADTRFNSGMYFDARNIVEQSAYAVANISAGLEGDGWSTAFWVKNVFDTGYRTFGVDLGSPFGTVGIAGPPRTFGVTLAVRF